MRPRLLLMGVLLAGTVAGGAKLIPWVLVRVDARAAFVRRAAVTLRACRTLEDLRALPADPQAELTVWKFGDGSWIAALNHPSNHHDQEWDATVLRDSAGRFSMTTEHFCVGFEKEKLEAPPIPSLAAFYRDYRTALGLRPLDPEAG